jgi:hypothetical protein
MAESEAQRVKVIGDSGESAAIVKDRRRTPWSVVEISEEGDSIREVEWRVIISLPSTPPLVFVSREAAKAWTDMHAQDFSWDCLNKRVNLDEATPQKDAMALTERFLKFAKEQRLPPHSLEAWRRAHEDEDGPLTNTLELFATTDCHGVPYVVPSNQTVQLGFTPYSCRSQGWSDLYDSKGEHVWLARAPVDCDDDIPLGAGFAYTG